MKKTLLTIAATVAITTSAQAQDLKVQGTEFSGGDFNIEGIIRLDLANTTSKDIQAFKGTILCLDAFDDEAIKLTVKARSANIPANSSKQLSWKASMFSPVNDILINNDAKNFKCSLEDQKIVN